MKLADLPPPLASLVQRQLLAMGFYHGTTNGVPGPKTESAYEAYLASLERRQTVAETATSETLRNAFIEIARSQIGVREEGGNNRGRRVQEYQNAASWLPGTGWAWCAAFVGWCFDRLAERYTLPFATPEGAGAFWYEDWARQQGIRVWSNGAKVKRGDVVIFSFSHIGIATSNESDGEFLCVEGNTNDAGSREGDGVFEKRRPKTQIRSILRPFP